jgi:hypothetical protein
MVKSQGSTEISILHICGKIKIKPIAVFFSINVLSYCQTDSFFQIQKLARVKVRDKKNPH